MKQDILKFVGGIAIIAVIISIIIAMIASIGSMKLTDGCLYRYNLSDAGTLQTSDKITNTITLKANANYKVIKTASSDPKKVNLSLDPNHYGEWLNTRLGLVADQVVNFDVKGEVSLCRAYVPQNNLYSTSNLDNHGNKIPIPRIEESDTVPISLIFDAKTDQWRNIAELYRNDHVVVSISPERLEKTDAQGNITVNVQNVSEGDIFNGSIVSADCREGKRTYSPICGRYSIYSGQYTSGCTWNGSSYDCNPYVQCFDGYWRNPDQWSTPGLCLGTQRIAYNRCGEWDNTYSTAPEPYENDGTFTFQWSNILSNLFTNTNLQCSDSNHQIQDKDYIIGDFQNARYFWYSANTATGLLQRLDSSETPTNASSRGTGYSFVSILSDQSLYNNDPEYKIIHNAIYSTTDLKYLQYRFHDDDGQFANNTGGYVLNIKQTKCRRSNGSILTDTVVDRGKIEYLLVAPGEDPNTSGKTYTPSAVVLDNNGRGSITATGTSGNLWMKIYNKQEDYKDSFGQYGVDFFTSQATGDFSALILNPLFEVLKDKITVASQMIFRNMICYGGDTASCKNFFNYIRGLLSLYIMLYGIMFLLGMVEINQIDLVIRVVKIAIVAGLMNEKTFDLFTNYVFEFVTGFSDQMISNMAGYSMFSTGTVSNPFMFMDEIMSKIFFSKTFFGQLLALISMGISGILYFVIIFITLGIIIVVMLRAIAVYIMAFMAIAVLIGLAPLFLTFMLFDFTRYLFDNWIKFTVRYMIEPVIMLAGIIILTQLFTIYLDFALGYSVCWKCALPIKIPFPAIPGLDFAFTNVELFCINWFVPWGFDSRSGMMGVNMQHFISLIIIAYCMYGYIELSGAIVTRLTAGIGGGASSATSMGNTMSSSVENKVLEKTGSDRESRSKLKNAIKQSVAKRASGDRIGAKDKAGDNKESSAETKGSSSGDSK